MKASSALGIKQIFTSWNNPKCNADTERVMRTIKEDLIWPREGEVPPELERALNNESTTTTPTTHIRRSGI